MSDPLRRAAEHALAKLERIWEIGVDAEYKIDVTPEMHALRAALGMRDGGERSAAYQLGYEAGRDAMEAEVMAERARCLKIAETPNMAQADIARAIKHG